MPDDTHQKHIDAARQRVAHLAALERASDEADKRIAKAATERLETVEAEIAKVRPSALIHDDAGTRYTELVTERGHLLEVLRRASAVA